MTALGLTFPVLCAKTWKLHRIVVFMKVAYLTILGLKYLKLILRFNKIAKVNDEYKNTE